MIRLRRRRIQLCPTGKFCYVRKEEAKRVIREQRIIPVEWREQGARRPQTYYRCPVCHYYHVTGMIGSLAAGNRKPI